MIELGDYAVAEELAGRLPAGTGYQPVLPSVLAIGDEEAIAGVAGAAATSPANERGLTRMMVIGILSLPFL